MSSWLDTVYVNVVLDKDRVKCYLGCTIATTYPFAVHTVQVRARADVLGYTVTRYVMSNFYYTIISSVTFSRSRNYYAETICRDDRGDVEEN